MRQSQFHQGYKSEDNKGKYRLVKLAKWGSAAKREDRPTMYFSLTSPDKKKIYPIAPDGTPGRWRVGRKKMKSLIDDELIEWVEDNNGIWTPYEKVYYDGDDVKTLKIGVYIILSQKLEMPHDYLLKFLARKMSLKIRNQ